jgi:hypothetical protein
MAITWLADVLRAAGLTVVEHAGWRTRTVSGTWTPQFGIVHATAAPSSQTDTTQIRIVRDGREGLDGPIANACVDRVGRWHVLAAGKCNTTIAGTAGPYDGKGNTYALGVEACHNNLAGTPWPDEQYDAYVRGWAAIARKLSWSADRLRGHKEHTPGHKTDPTFDMGLFRRRVAAVLAGEDDEMTPAQEKLLSEMSWQVRNVPAPDGTRKVLTGAVSLLVQEVLALKKVVAGLASASPLTAEQMADLMAAAEREAREEVAEALRVAAAAAGPDA